MRLPVRMIDEFESMEGVDPATSPEPEEQLIPSPTLSQQQQHYSAVSTGDMETEQGTVPATEG